MVIYNIFQVGIANKIQEYGKIKALGATKKQMKQLIFREGMFLTISSIPVGLLLGFLIAKCGFNWLVEQGNLVSTGTSSMGVQNQQVPLFSLPIMLLCIFVSFLTVALALRKPMKIVSRISPIEATRYLENAETQKKGKRNGRKNVTVFSMAMANVTGNPKRTIGTIITMGFSCSVSIFPKTCALPIYFYVFSAFSKYRVASIGEIRETIFIGLRSAKATVRNDTKIHRSIKGRENSGTC